MPHLVCNEPAADEQVDHYTIAGLPGDPVVPVSDDPTYGLYYDISALPEGTYSIRVSACNKWQCSLPAPLEFTVPGQPSQPTGLNISFI